MPKKYNYTRKTGRPTKYTPELVNEICARISRGETLLKICKDEHIPRRETIYEWLLKKEYIQFYHNYTKARDIQAEHFFDELVDIADDTSKDTITKNVNGEEIETCNSEYINRARLRVDTRKWYISKVLPKKYGDKLDVEHSGGLTINILPAA